ncbi:hypothetical protein JHW43_003686 [Diplocarpon mali]|nr:hypothetical protein JHW43_003686 [Diplocarpon mali]
MPRMARGDGVAGRPSRPMRKQETGKHDGTGIPPRSAAGGVELQHAEENRNSSRAAQGRGDGKGEGTGKRDGRFDTIRFLRSPTPRLARPSPRVCRVAS